MADLHDPDFIDSKPEIVERFVGGLYKAQQWLVDSHATTVADRVSPFFSDTSMPVLEASIQRYKTQGTWAVTPLIGEDGYDNMRDILIEGGVVKGSYPYDRLVRPDFANKAMQG